MQSRGRSHYKKTSRRERYTCIVFFIILIIWGSLFASYNNITNIIKDRKALDIFSNDLPTLALYTRTLNKDAGNFLFDIDTILNSYKEGENAFVEEKESINNARHYIYKNHEKLNDRGFDRYHQFTQLMANLYPYKEEIYDLLGENKATNYLVILQNDGEKRPNGGFFGSFAFAQFQKASIKELGILDTYFPNHIAPTTYLETPERSIPHLQNTQIGFVAANKYGFTDIDGKNIKTLYEKIFNEDYDQSILSSSAYSDLQKTLLHKNIKGVIFLRTDMFEESIEGMKEKIRERQFINASVDLIRGEERSHKKEQYLYEVNQFFQQNQLNIIKSMINNFETIAEKRLFNVYLSNVSQELNNYLQEAGIQTTYQSDHIYARDTNNAFNKADRFMTKEIVIYDDKKQHILSSNDIINIKSLTPGHYNMEVYYHFNVPQNYKDSIQKREKQYNIRLTEREKGILALGPTYNELRRATKSIIHFPKHRRLMGIEGDLYNIKKIDSGFSQGISYQSDIKKENQTNLITININIPEESKE